MGCCFDCFQSSPQSSNFPDCVLDFPRAPRGYNDYHNTGKKPTAIFVVWQKRPPGDFIEALERGNTKAVITLTMPGEVRRNPSKLAYDFVTSRR